MNMTEGNSLISILKFMYPLLLGGILQNLYNIVDTIVAGRLLGLEALSTVGNSFGPILFFNSIITGCASGILILESRNYGEKNNISIFSASLKLAIGLSFLVVLIAVATNQFIFSLMKIPSDIIGHTQKYFLTIIFGFPFVVIYSFTTSFLKARGNSRIPLYIIAISSVINLGFNIIAVAWLKMGIFGVAISTVITQAISAVISLLYFYSRYKEEINNEYSMVNIDNTIIKKILYLGLTSVIQNSLSAISTMYIQGVVNSFGLIAISAFAVATKIEYFLTIPIVSLGMALGVFVGQNMGAKREDRAVEGFRMSIKISLFLSFICILIVFVFSDYLMMLMVGKDIEVIELGSKYLRIISLFYYFLALLYILTNFLRSSGEVVYPIFNTFLELCSRIIFVTVMPLYIGINGVLLSRPLSFLVSSLSLLIRFKTQKWKETSERKENT